MLILTRRIGETLMIGDDVCVTVLGVRGSQVRVGVDAPKETLVYREEIYRRIQQAKAEQAEQQAGQEQAEQQAGQEQAKQQAGQEQAKQQAGQEQAKQQAGQEQAMLGNNVVGDD